MTLPGALTLLMLGVATVADAQWTQFRGPNGSGVGTTGAYPVEFSPTKNVAWKAAVPFGQSSPVVSGSRLFVTGSEGNTLVVLAFDTQSGKQVWRREIVRDRQHKLYKANDPASPTPIADDLGVVAFFPDFGLVAYDADGGERWRHVLGPFRNFYGMASSPVAVGDRIVLVCDQQAGSFMVALDRKSGKVAWRTERPENTVGWATPIVFRPSSGAPQLVVLGSTRVDGYDLATGQARWWFPVASNGGLGTPVVSGDTVLVSTLASSEPFLPDFGSMVAKYDRDANGMISVEEFKADDYAEHFGWIDDNDDGTLNRAEWDAARGVGVGDFGAVAVRPGTATGRLAPTAFVWRFQKNLPFVPAPLVYQDVFYMIRDGGIITSLDVATGRLLKEGRSRGALGEYYASPVAADGKVFLVSAEGKVTVLRAGGDWELLGVNELGDEVHATPALSDGKIYVRTRSTLYAFAAGGPSGPGSK
jgi:outer membrane protein assembly factor BamB